tara:strand:- start:171 stop:1121 length:951 start_codon:yes stop_codon:yes gene_type:complete
MVSEIKVDKLLNQSGDQDSGIDLSTNDVVAVKIAGSEKMRVHSDGKVGIGEDTPLETLQITTTDGESNIRLHRQDTAIANDDNYGTINWAGADSDSNADGIRGFISGKAQGTGGGFKMEFGTASGGAAIGSDPRMMIDADGNLLVSGTTFNSDVESLATGTLAVEQSTGRLLVSATKQPLELARTSGDNNSRAQIQFFREGSNVGSVTCTNTATAYNTSSDYRLKENVTTSWDATSRLKQLKPSRFNFKADKDTTVDGFLAHEVSSIVPEAVTGTKDAVDKDGKPEYQGIDQSKLVPLLVKTIQELEARITALEGK